jgi:hypothetical protein
MKWYWWLLLGVGLAVAGFVFLPMFLKSEKSDSLEIARKAKADKAKEKLAETETPADEGAAPVIV